jgi:wyosine [tRNA(Phe)-imidazoG37] synthetase (radical SAM superfamily)
MRDDLLLRLREDHGELKDIVLAGSGEPTAVPNLDDALEAIQNVCDTLQLRLPIKLFTNGRHLGHEDVREAVGRFARRGGQVWVKLDGARDDTVALINGRRFNVSEHLRALWAFASEHEVGLQTMLLRGPGLPDPSRVVDEVTIAVQAGISEGARVSEMHLLTLSRPPADERAAGVLTPVSLDDLESFAVRVREATKLPVAVFPA